MEEEIDHIFRERIDRNWLILVGVGVALVVLNTFMIALLEWKYICMINSMLKRAELIYSIFPINVLLENTYLTSYFNSKTKNAK